MNSWSPFFQASLFSSPTTTKKGPMFIKQWNWLYPGAIKFLAVSEYQLIFLAVLECQLHFFGRFGGMSTSYCPRGGAHKDWLMVLKAFKTSDCDFSPHCIYIFSIFKWVLKNMYTSSGNVNQLLSAWRCTQRLALLLLLLVLVLRVFETSDCDFSPQCISKWVLIRGRGMSNRCTPDWSCCCFWFSEFLKQVIATFLHSVFLNGS